MANEALLFLENHQSETPSRFTEYVSRLLSGTENLSFKSIANIEEKLGVNCLDAALS